jgi:hypothetical protein
MNRSLSTHPIKRGRVSDLRFQTLYLNRRGCPKHPISLREAILSDLRESEVSCMEWNFTQSQVAILASLIFIGIILFQFFIMLLMPPKDKNRR